MIVKTTKTVTFFLPNEYREAQAFADNHDMKEWIQSVTTQCISYTHTEYKHLELYKGEGEE